MSWYPPNRDGPHGDALRLEFYYQPGLAGFVKLRSVRSSGRDRDQAAEAGDPLATATLH
jgi:hypothetical protein